MNQIDINQEQIQTTLQIERTSGIDPEAPITTDINLKFPEYNALILFVRPSPSITSPDTTNFSFTSRRDTLISIREDDFCILSPEDKEICINNKKYKDDPLNHLISEVYKKTFVIVEDTITIQDAICLLYQKKCDSLLITHQKTYIKSLSRTDITRSILSNGYLHENKTLEEIIKLDESDSCNTIISSATILECLRRMKKTKTNILLVEEGSSGLSGIITEHSIFNYIGEQLAKSAVSDGENMSHYDYKTKKCLDSLSYQFFILFLLVVNIVIFIASFTYMNFDLAVIVNLPLSVILFIELLVRLKITGFRHMCVIDISAGILTIFALLTGIAALSLAHDNEKAKIANYIANLTFTTLRAFALGIIKAIKYKQKVIKHSKHLVSQNRRRYKKDGFDLDLTYITPRCIAMSLPSEKVESIYRNPIKEVARFFDTKHPDCYRIYNLCNERDYDTKYFHNKVIKYPIPDHNVPTLWTMHEFAKDILNYLNQSPYNVIAVHCKGGKGRTGCMICAYLLASGVCSSADAALLLFKEKRTYCDDNEEEKSPNEDENGNNNNNNNNRRLTISKSQKKHQGVSGPSQIRFVHYYERFLFELKELYNSNPNLFNTKSSTPTIEEKNNANTITPTITESSGSSKNNTSGDSNNDEDIRNVLKSHPESVFSLRNMETFRHINVQINNSKDKLSENGCTTSQVENNSSNTKTIHLKSAPNSRRKTGSSSLCCTSASDIHQIYKISQSNLSQFIYENFVKQVEIDEIVVKNLPKLCKYARTFNITDYQGNVLWETNLNIGETDRKKIVFKPSIKVMGEFKFAYKNYFFMCFVKEDMLLEKKVIDGACRNSKFGNNFQVTFHFIERI